MTVTVTKAEYYEHDFHRRLARTFSAFAVGAGAIAVAASLAYNGMEAKDPNFVNLGPEIKEHCPQDEFTKKAKCNTFAMINELVSRHEQSKKALNMKAAAYGTGIASGFFSLVAGTGYITKRTLEKNNSELAGVAKRIRDGGLKVTELSGPDYMMLL